ncbi:lipoprotein-attachment site-containing protein [Ectothiorhodosinus mongolicus]|uniref:Lipoprotein-attachment site-containing protein n=1 Tax=Ectothiorhodosinus mongolicus TaxID=233100 RepID=A0A1R3VY58_9GAMM|nr:lipoprotein [Ectothiorhodosinus mongolicus]ULX56999.1 hypothetical protein CKX93_04365 [Ectothiorhodosinus mongolicus]SIT69390.1 lipoprotein-attachment site-containing protein [Ectothiorhodosinus mongolicus]
MPFCWARSVFVVIVVVLGTASMVSSCGQKGDLFLPSDAPQQD